MVLIGSDDVDEASNSDLEGVEDKDQEVVRWVVDPQFKRERMELNIPEGGYPEYLVILRT